MLPQVLVTAPRRALAVVAALVVVGTAPRRALAVVAALVVVGCTASPSSDAPPPTGVARPTLNGPTPSLPVARAVAPSPSPVEASGAGPLAATQTLQLQSSAFAVGGMIPPEYTCDGADRSPPLSWTGVPLRTAAFTLVEQDLDAIKTGAPFTQWLIYNMPSRVSALDAGVPAKLLLTNGAQQGHNDQQTIGYLGPCPNHGEPPHHYNFQLIAQDAYVTLETGASIAGVRQALTGHSLGEARLVAFVQR